MWHRKILFHAHVYSCISLPVKNKWRRGWERKKINVMKTFFFRSLYFSWNYYLHRHEWHIIYQEHSCFPTNPFRSLKCVDATGEEEKIFPSILPYCTHWRIKSFLSIKQNRKRVSERFFKRSDEYMGKWGKQREKFFFFEVNGNCLKFFLVFIPFPQPLPPPHSLSRLLMH